MIESNLHHCNMNWFKILSWKLFTVFPHIRPAGIIFYKAFNWGYYFFTSPSTARIIRTKVLIECWYYHQNFINLDIETRKPWSLYSQKAFLQVCSVIKIEWSNISRASWYSIIKNKHKWGKSINFIILSL